MKTAINVARVATITVFVVILQMHLIEILFENFWALRDYAEEVMRDSWGVERWVRNGVYALGYAAVVIVWLTTISIAAKLVVAVYLALYGSE